MDTTEKLGLRLPGLTDGADVADLNYNAQVLDEEVAKRVQTVNGVPADEKGAVQVDEVPFARQLVSDIAQANSGTFVVRATGGNASVADGGATLVAILGQSVHTGYQAESLQMTVTPASRPGGAEAITASIDRDTFVGYVDESRTVTLSYTDAWSANPSLYGVTVSGTPVSGDVITIVYVKESRGTITMSTPSALRSTGWNLYNHETGYARVAKYSDTYGFLIGGIYYSVQFSATLDGEKTEIRPTGGAFTVPSDGYVWVNGGNAESTYVLMTWSNWTNGYVGEFQQYTEDEIDLSGVMGNFPYGLMQAGGVSDEINLTAQQCISRIERVGYSAAALEAAKATGRPYEYDQSYIYKVRETPVTHDINVDPVYEAYDHGMEIIDGTSVGPTVKSLYGQNLVDKLRNEVVAVTQQDFSANEQSQARMNIGAAADSAVIKTINHKYPDIYGDITIIEGAGDAELGSYRVNVTIPVNSWTASNGAWVATYSDPLIASDMDGVETWMDDPTAMLGPTTFSTADGALTITTAIKPTAAWNLHVTLATNGANVLSMANTKANKATVAYVEDGDTAYHNMAVGDYVIWKEELYRVNTAIAVGDTISGKVTRQEAGGLNAMKSGVTEISISSEYTTVLSAINAYRASKCFPFSIIKVGSSAYTDLPTGVNNTCEWTLVCSGDSARATAVLTVFNGGGSENGSSYTANIYSGSYILNWKRNEKTKVEYLTLINLQSLTSAYVTSNTYSGRSFASSVFLVFNIMHKSWVKDTQIVPYATFKQNTGVELRCNLGETLIEVDVKYVSDTSYQAKYIGTLPDSNPFYVSCYAIMLE